MLLVSIMVFMDFNIKTYYKTPEGKRPLWIPTLKWEDNITIDLKYDGRMWTDSFGSKYRPVAGSCDHSNEPFASIKGGEFLDSAPCSM
jgi:hypothetical protein